jgi:hypothetical protein
VEEIGILVFAFRDLQNKGKGHPMSQRRFEPEIFIIKDIITTVYSLTDIC